MPLDDPKATLHRYLQQGREALLWKLDGLSEYDLRRPVVRSATNLLGLVKHVASVEIGYLGDVFGRPSGVELPWFGDDAEDNDDMWATSEQTVESIVGLYRRSSEHCDETIRQLDLDAVGIVPWWPEDRREVSLHLILVHVIAETNRHAGHADLARELIDGSLGLRPDNGNLPEGDDGWWDAYRAKVQAAADRFRIL